MVHPLASSLSSLLTTSTCQRRRSTVPNLQLNCFVNGWTTVDGTTSRQTRSSNRSKTSDSALQWAHLASVVIQLPTDMCVTTTFCTLSPTLPVLRHQSSATLWIGCSDLPKKFPGPSQLKVSKTLLSKQQSSRTKTSKNNSNQRLQSLIILTTLEM